MLKAIVNLSKLAIRGKFSTIAYILQTKALNIDLSFDNSHEPGAKQCTDSGGPDLARVIKTLGITDRDQVIDIGCGKGGAIFTLSRFPFRRVDGIEISWVITEIAEDNIRRAGIKNSTIYYGSATDIASLDRYTVIYMANPFTRPIMEKFMQRVKESLYNYPRKITIVYKFPVDGDLVEAAGFKKTAEFNHSDKPFFVYTNR